MQLTITGKNLEITDWLREYVEKKFARLDRTFPNITDARVELTVENTRAAKDRQVAQITLRSRHQILRAEVASSDMFSSIDAAVDKLQRQIDRYRGKRTAKRAEVEGEEAILELAEEEEALEEEPRISRVKRFTMVPMDEEEAIDQMELLGHDFFMFFNSSENQINVVYRRRNGDYGLIQPDLG